MAATIWLCSCGYGYYTREALQVHLSIHYTRLGRISHMEAGLVYV